jgi:GGDEF domain-containing protein
MIVLGRTDLMAKLIEAASDCGNIQLGQLQDLIEQLQHRVESLAEVFTVRLDHQQSYREILEQAHQQMATVAVDALPEMVGAAPCSLVDQQRQVSSALLQFQSRHTPLGQKGADEATHPASDSLTSETVAVQPTADPGLLGRLALAINTCRRTRGEVSLALVEVDDYDGLLLSLGPERVADIVRSMETAIYANTDDQCDCLLATDSRYAIILPHCDRPRAVSATRWLLEEIPRWAEAHTGRSIDLHCSAGVATLATPGSNYPPQQLNAAAERCLFAAQASGGRLVKSIDLW